MAIDAVCEVPDAKIKPPAEVTGHQEADHRVANSLQLISALLSFQARQSAVPEVRAALASAMNRIAAVAGVHRQLCRSESQNVVEIASYCVELSAALEQCCGGSLARRHIIVDVERHLVPVAVATTMGIIITELVMNACKHAYAPDEPGTVDVSLSFPAGAKFRLEVRDYGGSTTMQSSPCPGIGSRIVEVMSRKLNAVYTYIPEENGTRFLMSGSVDPDLS